MVESHVPLNSIGDLADCVVPAQSDFESAVDDFCKVLQRCGLFS